MTQPRTHTSEPDEKLPGTEDRILIDRSLLPERSEAFILYPVDHFKVLTTDQWPHSVQVPTERSDVEQYRDPSWCWGNAVLACEAGPSPCACLTCSLEPSLELGTHP